jgi:Tol biopolymer transport system component
MAISLARHNFLQWMVVGTLAEAPLSGGPPREILDNVCDADITADGKQYAIVRCEESVQKLEFPIGHVLFSTNGWISHPRISPSGDGVAFLEHPLAGDDRGYVSIVDTAGHRKHLTEEWVSEFGLAWDQSGRELWFSSTSGEKPQEIRAVSRSGQQRTILSTVSDIALHDVSKEGTVLLTSVRVSTEIDVGRKGNGPDRLLELPDEHVNLVGLSFDGKTIALGVSGVGSGQDYFTVVMKEGTREAVRLGEGDPISVSPDGRWILSVLPSQPNRLILYPTGIGEVRPIDVSPVHVLNIVSSWTSDGSKVLFMGAERDGPPQAFLLDTSSGNLSHVTSPGTSDAIVSPDGRYVVAKNPSNKFFVYPVSGGESRPVGGMLANEFPIQWDTSSRRLYVWSRTLPAKIFLVDIGSGTRRPWLEITPSEQSGLLYGEVVITPDGLSYGYRYRRVLTDLFLARGLR